MRYEWTQGIEMIDSQVLRDEIVRRETVADFAQLVRGRTDEQATAKLDISGLMIYLYTNESEDTHTLTHTLDAVRRVLTAFAVTDPSGVGFTDIECDVSPEEMLVIEECMINPDAYVETIIDRVWDV